MTIDEIFQSIKPELATFETIFNNVVVSSVELVSDVIQHINSQKGKRLRPGIMFLIAKALQTNPDNKRLYDSAATIEILHTATLIHDDIVDEATQRRGMLSINTKWNNKISVLTGDFLYSRSMYTVLKNKDYDFVEILRDTSEIMSEGELLAMQYTNSLNCDEQRYYKIILSKTASLVSAACKVSAMICSDNTNVIDKFAEYGKLIGMAFQIKDDIFDYSDNSNITGKPAGNDIREKQLPCHLFIH